MKSCNNREYYIVLFKAASAGEEIPPDGGIKVTDLFSAGGRAASAGEDISTVSGIIRAVELSSIGGEMIVILG